MPAQTQKTPKIIINLLPQDPFLETIFGKFLLWALSIGRYIVIFTELIVILTFLSRFKLDRDLTDLNEAINQQKAILLSYQETEQQFLSLQKSTNFLVKQRQNEVIAPTLTMLEKILPIDVRLSSLRLTSNGWQLSGQALSAQGMKMFIDQVVAQNPQHEVVLSSVRLDSRIQAIVFEVRLNQQTMVTNLPSATKRGNDNAGEDL